MFVNSADDFINPPELGIAQREIKNVKRGKFVLIPASDQTHGHGTHTGGLLAAVFAGAAGGVGPENQPGWSALRCPAIAGCSARM